MSLKKCIETECKNCSYVHGADGNWREQVKNCQGVSCELYPVRPLPTNEKHDERASRRDAVDSHCKACIYDPEDKDARGSWRAQTKNCKSEGCAIWPVRPIPTKVVNV